jgi:hypothetical protein
MGMIYPEPKVSYILHERERADSTLVFLHLQKCAGTTLHEIIKRQYDRMYGTENLYPCQLHWWPHEDTVKNVLVFKGHFSYGQENQLLLPEGAIPRTYVTILRNPIDRVLSGYHFHFIRFKTFTKYEGEMISLTDFLKGNYLINSNLMTYMLGGHQTNIDRAIENLHRFDIVGLAEEFDVFLKRLDKTLGWPTPYEYERCNVQPDRVKAEDLDDEQMDIITKYNAFDFRLYEEAVRMVKNE